MLKKNWREERTRKIQKMEVFKLKLQYPQIKSHGKVVTFIYMLAVAVCTPFSRGKQL